MDPVAAQVVCMTEIVATAAGGAGLAALYKAG